jgi:hypothetical protein
LAGGTSLTGRPSCPCVAPVPDVGLEAMPQLASVEPVSRSRIDRVTKITKLAIVYGIKP